MKEWTVAPVRLWFTKLRRTLIHICVPGHELYFCEALTKTYFSNKKHNYKCLLFIQRTLSVLCCSKLKAAKCLFSLHFCSTTRQEVCLTVADNQSVSVVALSTVKGLFCLCFGYVLAIFFNLCQIEAEVHDLLLCVPGLFGDLFVWITL